MNDPVSFILSALTLLIVPGPTNTLLAAAGAGGGMRRSLPLVPAECCGYLLAVLTLLLVVSPLAGDAPVATFCLRIGACCYLFRCAVGLWCRRDSAGDTDGRITPSRVFLATLLNPKAVLFALVIFPQETGPAVLAFHLSLFSGAICAVAVCWIAVGAGLARSAPSLLTASRIRRAAALALAGFATVLAGSALAAAIS